MALFFLIIIYLAFISLGLPDSLLGSGWPAMRGDFGIALSGAGVVSMVITCGTIISSLLSGKLLNRFGTGKVTFFSCFMTAAALLGFSFSPSYIWLIFLALPLGLGAGAVDAGLNTFVAGHYKAHHMSWLHCFWGVGATLGPILMSGFISREDSWRKGYLCVAIIQFVLVVVLFFTLPLWKKAENGSENVSEEEETVYQGEKQSFFKLKGVKFALLSFFFYCGIETTMGLWGSSYLVQVKGVSPSAAAGWISMFFVGITVGRLVSGFITMKVSNKNLIRLGQLICFIGIVVMLLPLPVFVSIAGFILVGLGCAPIYPCMLHETPVRFGKENAQSIMGYQMAFAYIGSTVLPPALGFIAGKTTIGILPVFAVCYCIMMFVGSEKINYLVKNRRA